MATTAFGAVLIGLLLTLAPPAAHANGTLAFAPGSEGLPETSEWRTHPALGDVNGDGHLDLVAHVRKNRGPRVWLGDGQGGWTLSSRGLSLPGGGCGVGVDLADVNGDGHLDLGVADHCHGLFVFLGDGRGGWRPSDAGRLGGGAGYEDLRFGDVDGDGDMDLVAGGAFTGGLLLLLGDGSGGWEAADRGLPSDGFVRDIKLGDINGDGRLDVAAAFSANSAGYGVDLPRHNTVWISDAEGRYRPANTGIPGDRQTRGVALGDVNGDGHLDLALSLIPRTEDDAPLKVYLGDGTGRWRDASEGLPTDGMRLAYMGVEFADMDGDGHPDLVTSSFSDARLEIWRGDGQGGWSGCATQGLPAARREYRGWGVAVGDVDGDGRPDLASGFGRSDAGGLEVWLQRNPSPAPASPGADAAQE